MKYLVRLFIIALIMANVGLMCDGRAVAEESVPGQNSSQNYWNPAMGPYNQYIANDQQTGLPSEASYSNYSARFKIGSDEYYINDVSFPMDVKPYASKGRSFVPVRYLAYACGINDDELEYWPASRMVIMNGSSGVLRLRLGSNLLYCNDQLEIMDVCPELRTNRIFLPARYVAEFFGYSVEWDENTRTITICG